MKNTIKTTGIRIGTIDNNNIEVEYSISATFNGQNIIAVKGYFIDVAINQKYSGTTPRLSDLATSHSFDIVVSSEHFSLLTNYDNINELF